MAERPLCFIIMPFGLKKDPGSSPDIDFDRIYNQAIQPSIETAGIVPVRADEERIGMDTESQLLNGTSHQSLVPLRPTCYNQW